MATTEEYKNGGSASYSFSIEYIKAEDIKVTVDGTSLTYTATNPPAQTTEYTVNGSNIIFKQASVSGSTTGGVRIYRETELENSDSVTFQAGSSIRAADLNANQKLVRLSAQEQNQKIVTADIKDSQITSAKIKDGTIVDADVNASAAIAGTKISPDFGSQNITTTGTVNGISTTEISILGGATVTTSELNTLDGVTATKDEINILDGVTATTNEINILDGVTADKDELNLLDGVTATTTELNYVDGVTSDIQTQLDNKQPLDSELTELATMSSGTASALADLTGTEVSILDGATISTTQLNNLQNIEPAAKDDQTGSEIKSLYEAESDTNAFTDAEKTKLTGIATGADVTSSNSINALTDVNTSGVADGKILKYQASSSSFIIADDGGSGGGASAFTGLSDTPANYGNAANKTLKINSAGDAVEFVDASFAGLTDTPSSLSGQGGKAVKVNTGGTALEFAAADVVDDTTPQLGGNLDVQDKEINTSTTNGNIKVTPNGTGLFEVKGNTNAGTLQLNCESNSHGVKIKSPPHSAAQDYTLTLPATNPSTLNNSIGWLRINQNGELQIDPQDYVQIGEHLNMGAFDITFIQTGGIYFDSDNTNNNKVGFFGATTIPSDVNFSLPGADGNAGTFLKTDGAGNLSFASADVVADTTPQLGGDLDVNGKSIIFDNNNIFLELKTGATNAVVNGVTQHVQQGSLIIDGGTKDLFLTAGTSSGGKITFGSSDGATHEVMRITPSVLGASQHGKVNLNYVTANVGGNTSSANRLETTSTGMTFTGVIVPAADSTHDLGTDAVRWRNLYADTLYGDGSNLTGLDSTTAGGAIYENSNTISQTHTIPSGSNGMSAGPVSVSNGVTLTISSGSTYTVV